jgi:hypothetical protein
MIFYRLLIRDGCRLVIGVTGRRHRPPGKNMFLPGFLFYHNYSWNQRQQQQAMTQYIPVENLAVCRAAE